MTVKAGQVISNALKSKSGRVVLTVCVGVGLLYGIRTMFAPTYWGSMVGGYQSRDFQDASCTSLKHCVFVGGSSFGGVIRDGRVVLSKISGFRTSKTTNFPALGPYMTSVTCPTVKLCIALASNGKLFIDFSGRWSAGGSLGSGAGELFNSISCASQSFCMVGSSSGDAYLLSGGEWVNLGNPPNLGFGEILDVSCPVVGTCFVGTGEWNVNGGDSEGQIFSFSQGQWHTETPVIANGIYTISCTDINFCVAGTNGDEFLMFQDGFWSKPQVITTDPNRIGHEYLVSTSCSSRNFCVALSDDFYAYTWNGQQWDLGRLVDPNPAIPVGVNAISCFSGNRCVVAAQDIWIHSHI